MTALRHNCRERNQCWLNRRWDPGRVGEAAREDNPAWHLPRYISPTDIDGLLECGGHVLFIESKTTGVELPKGGQKMALETLARMGATVLIQECETPANDSVEFIQAILPGIEWTPRVPCNRRQRDGSIKRWCEWADAGGRDSHPWRKQSGQDELM